MKKELYKNLKDKGWRVTDIAKKFGVTRQAVSASLKYKYRRVLSFCKICSAEITEWKRRSYCKNHSYLSEMSGRDFLRELVRIRDNLTCQFCFKVWEEGRKFDVHHLEKELESNRTYKASKDMTGMVTICHKCHLNLPEVRAKMRLGWLGISGGA